MFSTPASILPFPFRGDGVTVWTGGFLTVRDAPPGSCARLAVNGLHIATAIVGLNGVIDFFRPPYDVFPVGRMPELQLELSAPHVNGPIEYSWRRGGRDIMPLFVRSQSWAPPPYPKKSWPIPSGANNHILSCVNSSAVLRHIRDDQSYTPLVPPMRRGPQTRRSMM